MIIETLSEEGVKGDLAPCSSSAVGRSGTLLTEASEETNESFLRLNQPQAELLYGASLHPLLHTLKPFLVTFERLDSGTAAYIQDLEEYGFGENRSEALDDLRRTLAELYFSLEHEQNRLSGYLSSVWQVLQCHVARWPRR